jgi:hypothetical protein
MPGISEFGNVFEELRTRELDTQWKHKISVIPEAEGVADKWWTYTSGVSREKAAAKVPAGESIQTRQKGEYIVGTPALAGGGFRLGATLPQPGTNDDVWCGYTNRLTTGVTAPDGVGVGVTYFNEGEGDGGGALTDGVQPYAWFDSALDAVPNRVVPADQWNAIEDWRDKLYIDHFRAGAFIRIPHTYYNEGNAAIRIGDKVDGRVVVREVHRFQVTGGPMWSQSDLEWQQQTEGANCTSYLAAAHYAAGDPGAPIRTNGEGRGGGVGGAVSLTEDAWHPLISIRLRTGWENVNPAPLSFSIDCDDDVFVQLTRNADLDSTASFGLPSDTTSQDAAIAVDNTATGFAGGVGDREYFTFASDQLKGGGTDAAFRGFTLVPGDTLTFMVKPLNTSTAFNGASLRWGGNF